MDIDKIKQMNDLAREVLKLSRNTLLVNLRFLDMALSRPQTSLNPLVSLATNGIDFFYDPIYVLRLYKKEREEITRAYLHMVMHCIFRHMYIHTLLERKYWDLACDIAVENVITELDLRCLSSSREASQAPLIKEIKAKVNKLTAEKLYAYFMANPPSEQKLEMYCRAFASDDHMVWYLPTSGTADGDRENDEPEQQTPQGNSYCGSKGNQDGNLNNQSTEDAPFSGIFSYENGSNQKQLSRPDFSKEQDWKSISERVKQDVEMFSKIRGSGAGSLTQNIAAVNREKYDYTTFLKKFSVMGEAMKINDDEFDYVFYTYGLKLYDKMPLVEPLEYKEVKRIKDFVIAIDTSGSVKGALVQKFIQKTFNILKSTESFFSKINLHIIQCDAEIQSDVKVTNQEEFDKYIKEMKLRGFGGTDFRPVFSYVDKLIKDKEFTNLKGLIYFTDGYGDFPKRKPDYHTAFVFIDDDYNNPYVPSWAIKLVLASDEI